MLKLLLKKQLAEVFKGYFYNAKKNKKRSKLGIIGWFVFFVVIMVGLLGGMFSYFSLAICGALSEVGMDWLYFILMGIIAIALGAFGSVFNTYAGLYLSKDNDLLLSLPIPVKYIIASRLLNVYLMGAMYSLVVFIPALIVYWIVAGVTAAKVICGILMFLLITLIVMILSCLLGWCVAKTAQKVKNKSFVTVILSLVFFAAYYFVYFKAQVVINDLVVNATVYGAKIKGSAYALYLFGRVACGDWLATAIYVVAVLVLLAVTWLVLKNTFLSIATSSGVTKKTQYKEQPVKENPVFAALLKKEIARFISSANYMLNCGLGIIFLIAAGVALLIKGHMLVEFMGEAFSERGTGFSAVVLCALIGLIASINDIAAPSISLEGKNLWIYQSLPIHPRQILRAKVMMHFLLSGIPALFAAICAAIIYPGGWDERLSIILVTVAFVLFTSIFGTFIGLKMPNLNWTNEIAPIKQSGCVMIALFTGWLLMVALVIVYYLVGYKMGAVDFMIIVFVALILVSRVLLSWLDKQGAVEFARL